MSEPLVVIVDSIDPTKVTYTDGWQQTMWRGWAPFYVTSTPGSRAWVNFHGTRVRVFGAIQRGTPVPVQLNFELVTYTTPRQTRIASATRNRQADAEDYGVWFDSGELNLEAHEITLIYQGPEDVIFAFDKLEYEIAQRVVTTVVDNGPASTPRASPAPAPSTASNRPGTSNTSSPTSTPSSATSPTSQSGSDSSTRGGSSTTDSTTFILHSTHLSGSSSTSLSPSGGVEVPGETVSSASRVPIGAIVGGVIGGLAFLLAALVVLLVIRRRRTRQKGASDATDDTGVQDQQFMSPFQTEPPPLHLEAWSTPMVSEKAGMGAASLTTQSTPTPTPPTTDVSESGKGGRHSTVQSEGVASSAQTTTAPTSQAASEREVPELGDDDDAPEGGNTVREVDAGPIVLPPAYDSLRFSAMTRR